MKDLRIEQVAIKSLDLGGPRPRVHSKRKFKLLSGSILRYGFLIPIIIDASGIVIAGFARVKAAQQLGFTTVPAIRVSHLTEAEKRAFVIADNRLAEKATWDRAILSVELQGLIDIGFDIELTGFETTELDFLLDECLEVGGLSPAAEDALPAPQNKSPVSQSGDLWILGHHRLLCADAQHPESYGRLLAGKKADLVFTDPPYNVRINGHVSGRGRVRHREFVMACGEMSDSEFAAFLKKAFELVVESSRDGALHYICMDWRHLYELLAAGREIYDALINICVWNKDNGGVGSLYRSKHELVVVFKVGDTDHINNVELGRHGRNRTNVWDYAGVNSFRKGRLDDLAMHPTVKPVALVADVLRDASNRGDLVLDPFAGSGTTIIAAEKTGRRVCALEIDPHYVDVIVQRWQAYTGKTALLEATSASFEDVMQQRQGQIDGQTSASADHAAVGV
jgi:DNA modification methylase